MVSIGHITQIVVNALVEVKGSLVPFLCGFSTHLQNAFVFQMKILIHALLVIPILKTVSNSCFLFNLSNRKGV